MYDYLAKVILIGPSGSGKFVRSPCSRTISSLQLQILPSAPHRERRVYVTTETLVSTQLTH